MGHKTRLLLCFLLPLLCYAPATRCGFVWDDHQVIERGQLIGSLRNVPLLFRHDTMYNTDGGIFAQSTTLDTYRPLTLTTFFVEHALWGKRPAVYHAGSLLLHALNVLLCYTLASRLGLSQAAAMGGALLFAAHPAIAEGVYWINGRSDPLCACLFFCALCLWLRWLADGEAAPAAPAPGSSGRTHLALVLAARPVGVASLFFLATLSKETAFLMLPPLWVLWRGVRQRTPALVAALPWLAGAAAGLGLRLLALRGLAVHYAPALLLRALLRVPALWLLGLYSLLRPAAELQPSLSEEFARLPAWQPVCGAALVAVLTVLAWRSRKPLLGWALLTFLFTLTPIGLITFIDGWSGWGRYLYLGAPGLCLSAAYLLIDALRPRLPAPRRWAPVALLGGLVLACGAATFLFGGVWHDDRSFAEAEIVDHPNASTGFADLAQVDVQDGDPASAFSMISRALVLAPDNGTHWSRAASVLLQLKRRQEALRAAQRALSLNPMDNHARYLQVMALLQEGHQPEAAAVLLEVLALQPEWPVPWRLLDQLRKSPMAYVTFFQAMRAGLGDPRYGAIAPLLRSRL